MRDFTATRRFKAPFLKSAPLHAALTAGLFSVMAASSAMAEDLLGQPTPGGIDFQPAASTEIRPPRIIGARKMALPHWSRKLCWVPL